LRVGIDPPGRIPRHDYVLGRFTEEQSPRMNERLGHAADAAWCWANEGVDTAMNRYNTRKARRPAGQDDADDDASPKGAGPSSSES